MTVHLHLCRTCEKPLAQPFQEVDLVYMVCCHKFFHIAEDCLQGCASRQVACPNCRNTFDLHQAGKNLQGVWQAFLLAAEYEPNLVQTTLEAEIARDEPDIDCPVCSVEFPIPNLYYLPEEKRLCHTTCPFEGKGEHIVHLSYIATVLKELCQSNEEFKDKFLSKKPIQPRPSDDNTTRLFSTTFNSMLGLFQPC